MAHSPEIFDQIKSLLGPISADDALKEIARLDAEIESLQAEQAKWRTILGLINQLGTATVSVSKNGSDEAPTMRQAVRRVLEDQAPGTAMKLKVIGLEIIEREWMDDIEKDWHRLQMMASTMYRQNQLERPKMGYYRLPLAVAAAGEEDEGQGALETPPAVGAG